MSHVDLGFWVGNLSLVWFESGEWDEMKGFPETGFLRTGFCGSKFVYYPPPRFKGQPRHFTRAFYGVF